MKSDEECELASKDLDARVNQFHGTFATYSHEILFGGYELLRGINSHKQFMNSIVVDEKVTVLGNEQLRSSEISTAPEDRFMVQYPRNEHFKGRKKLLETLRGKLLEEVPGSWQHRVALHGLGGVGKTQLALEYAHSQRGNYDWVFWISAVREDTLLSGLQDIATRTNCITTNVSLTPTDVARHVLNWMNKRESWLLVIDNLDDMSVVAGYLPNPSGGRHTLITTRNQHCEDFQAEGLMVETLDVEDAIDLLLVRSKVGADGETVEGQNEATKIVNALGCLPLAIEQAAAFIRESLKDLFKYLPSYRENLKKHLERMSKANQTYYKDTVATTWRMSFQQIEESNGDASRLL